MRIKKNIQAKEKKSNIPLPNKNINISENQNIFMSDLILLHALPENNIMIKMEL
jgi:uncharacterized protein YllA (UPF0747 family)